MLSIETITGILDSRLGAAPALAVFPCVTSTNTVCAERAAQPDFVSPFVCIANQQTAGRGRRGRVWDSPPSAGLYLSLAWGISDIEAWQGLSLAVGLVIAQVLEKTAQLPGLQLKWPNDILQDNKKLGGVLIEVVRDAANAPVLVIGAGINCERDHAQTDAITNERAYLSDSAATVVVSRNALAAELVAAMLALLQSYESKQFRGYRADWERYDAYRDREVVLLTDGNVTAAGIEQGVNDQGELRVLVDGVLRNVSTGEVSLRLGR